MCKNYKGSADETIALLAFPFVLTPAIGARCHGPIIPHAATTPLGGHGAHQPQRGDLTRT